MAGGMVVAEVSDLVGDLGLLDLPPCGMAASLVMAEGARVL